MASFLDQLPTPATLLALGEPTHGESAFPQIRNQVFATLADRGFRSIALESDRVAGLVANAFVQGSAEVSLATALREGFSHQFGAAPANRDLLIWMRERNAGRPVEERLTFYGFDAPLELTGAPSPRRYLAYVHRFLGLEGWSEIDRLIGDDARWSDSAAIWEAGRSVGRSADAQALRAIADDLRIRLYAEAPHRIEGWSEAETYADAALGLLAYHAQAAEDLPETARIERLAGVRDVLMARNLLAIRSAEAHRGPTLVFAGNRHLQRNPSTMSLFGMDLEWASAGSIAGAVLGDSYRVVVGSLGASPVRGIGAPAPGTYEATLADRTTEIFPASEVEPAEPRAVEQGYFPLDAATIEHADGVLHVATGLDPATLAGRIRALPGVDELVASEEGGAPEGSWGDRFFYVGPDRRQPFATIVERDVPGFDEASELNRPGVFRLNLDLGRAVFERLFGFPPKDFEQHRAEFDFAALDRFVPHPGYALYGFGSIVMPGPQMLPEIDRLLAVAHARAVDRHERAARRSD